MKIWGGIERTYRLADMLSSIPKDENFPSYQSSKFKVRQPERVHADNGVSEDGSTSKELERDITHIPGSSSLCCIRSHLNTSINTCVHICVYYFVACDLFRFCIIMPNNSFVHLSNRKCVIITALQINPILVVEFVSYSLSCSCAFSILNMKLSIAINCPST